jgi:7-cyano-7-deazaguanine synthase
MTENKAIVLLSGGQDSATCLSIACQAGYDSILAVTFEYGQRHVIELKKAVQLAEIAGVPIRIVEASFIAQLSTTALTSATIPITTEEGELPSTFVPGRNLFFLSMAAVIARQEGVRTLYMGVCQTDFSGYPDCRVAFIQSAETTINLAMETTIQIKTPLMNLTKAETIMLMKELGTLSWYADTHTCYEGRVPACGRCPACQLRLKGFELAGIQDPIEYC